MLSATQIRDLARRYDVHPSKALGQNFVVDPNTIRRIVRLAEIAPDDLVVEVGPGFGSLTLALAEAASQVVAIELDRRLFSALQEVLAPHDNVTLMQADALTVVHREIFGGKTHRVVANLPYNIATHLVAGWLTDHAEVADVLVMVQREVGERLVAPPGSKTYGAVSVLVAYHSDARMIGRVPRSVFWPQPEVDSVLVRLTRHAPPVDVDAAKLMEVVRAGFAQRRKTIRNALAASFPEETVSSALTRAGIDPRLRAEALDLGSFAAIAEAIE